MAYQIVYGDELYHYGVKGMKWGKNIFGKEDILSGPNRASEGARSAYRVNSSKGHSQSGYSERSRNATTASNRMNYQRSANEQQARRYDAQSRAANKDTSQRGYSSFGNVNRRQANIEKYQNDGRARTQAINDRRELARQNIEKYQNDGRARTDSVNRARANAAIDKYQRDGWARTFDVKSKRAMARANIEKYQDDGKLRTERLKAATARRPEGSIESTFGGRNQQAINEQRSRNRQAPGSETMNDVGPRRMAGINENRQAPGSENANSYVQRQRRSSNMSVSENRGAPGSETMNNVGNPKRPGKSRGGANTKTSQLTASKSTSKGAAWLKKFLKKD